MKTVQAELPEKLYDQIKALIDEGWFTNEKDVIELGGLTLLADFQDRIIPAAVFVHTGPTPRLRG